MNSAHALRARWTPWILCASFLLIAGISESASQKWATDCGYLTTSRDQNTAVASALGEFRIVTANVLWSEVVDHYHHRYIHAGGDWSKDQTILPLLKTIIALDPHFVEAYETLGVILPRLGRNTEGEAIIEQGIRYNPGHWELYRDMALMYAKQKQWTEALPYAQIGLKYTDDDFAHNIMQLLCGSVTRDIRAQQQQPVAAKQA